MSNIRTSKRASISHLPPEILTDIFVHCLGVDSGSQGAKQLLCSVCRLWCALVLATPALWASLDIICNYSILHPPLPIIRTHLRRSRTRPLSLILHAADSEYSLDNPNLLPVLTALATARQRWRSVHIELDWISEEIFDLITLGDAPLLQNMQCSVMKTQWNLPIPLRMLDHCPRLEIFQWRGFGSPLLLPLGDTRLTSVSLRTSLSVSECITLLRLSPYLSSADFRNFFSPDSSPASHLTHPTLRSLITVGEHSNSLLAALTLPALQDLDILIGNTVTLLPTHWEIALSAFLERSKPRLHLLSLFMTDMRSLEPALLGILALTPHLHTLTLSDCRRDPPPFTAAVVRALHPLLPDTPLCPRLQKLELFCISDCPDGLCTAMLRSRWGTQAHANEVACLEWVHIEFEGGVHECDEANMEELRAEGMEGKLFLRD